MLEFEFENVDRALGLSSARLGRGVPTFRAATLGIECHKYTTDSVLYFGHMDVYERETQEIIKRFLERRLNFAECIAALDAALAGLIPTLTGEEIPRLRVVMLANNEIVMKEMERRGRRSKTPSEHF